MPSQPGKLYLVSLGTGDPDHLTLRADRILREADLVLGQADAPDRYPAQLAGKRFMEAGHGLFTPMAKRRAPREEVEAEESPRRQAIRDCVAAGATRRCTVRRSATWMRSATWLPRSCRASPASPRAMPPWAAP
ncbi:MAG: hypothetical protein ABT00_13480 [Bordetella sp. SCN 68-11]|nr:MAG: hypothetical protein ABT00_13480 [Bordetella sp. SCN 68-11]